MNRVLALVRLLKQSLKLQQDKILPGLKIFCTVLLGRYRKQAKREVMLLCFKKFGVYF